MNTRSPRPSWIFSRLRWYVLVAVVPIAFAAVALLVSGYREWAAAQSVRAQRASWSEQGVPFSNVSSKDWYAKRTHSEGTEDWQRILQLAQWGMGAAGTDLLPYLGSEGKPPVELTPGGDWQGEPLVASFLKEMESVLQLIEKASKHPKPVRFPIEFNGIGTLLEHHQNSRTILRLLSLDFDFAYYHKDTKRALRDLELMQATIDAFNSQETMVSELVNIALRGVRSSAIRRSLTNNIWTNEELDVLRKAIAASEPLGERFKTVMTGERAFGLTAIESLRSGADLDFGQLNKLFPLSPSAELVLMNYYDRAINLPSADLKTWQSSAASIETMTSVPRNSSAAVWIGMLLPAVQAVVAAEIRIELDRRWTQTAIALRQYKSQNGKWPSRLRDLETLGISLDDYSTADGQVFGYEVDGDNAYLWSVNPASLRDPRISPTRPSKRDDTDSHSVEVVDEQLAGYLLELK